MNKKAKQNRTPAGRKVKRNTVPAAESAELREMRESIEEMEHELAEMDKDIADARRCPDPEIRETALRNFTEMRRCTREMIASFRESYRLMQESEALEARISDDFDDPETEPEDEDAEPDCRGEDRE